MAVPLPRNKPDNFMLETPSEESKFCSGCNTINWHYLLSAGFTRQKTVPLKASQKQRMDPEPTSAKATRHK